MEADGEEHLLVLLHGGEHLAREILTLRLRLLLIGFPLCYRLLFLLLLLVLRVLAVRANTIIGLFLLSLSGGCSSLCLFSFLKFQGK